MMKRIITALRKPALVAGFLLSAAAALAQTYPGQFPANTVYGNATGSTAAPTPGQVTGNQITTGTVTNANHANMNAGTVKSNNTGSPAAPSDNTTLPNPFSAGTSLFPTLNGFEYNGTSAFGANTIGAQNIVAGTPAATVACCTWLNTFLPGVDSVGRTAVYAISTPNNTSTGWTSVFAARSSDNTNATPQNIIPGNNIVVHDNATIPHQTWSGYDATYITAGAIATTHIGREISIFNNGAACGAEDPFTINPTRGCVGLRYDCALSGALGLNDCGTAIDIINNGAKTIVGINFANNSLDTGVNANPPAIALPSAYAITGYTAAATVSGRMYFDSSSKLNLTPVAGANINGTNTNDNAAAGQVGQYVTASNTGVALTTGVVANITSISLTAGDWEITGWVSVTTGAGATLTQITGVATTVSSSSVTPIETGNLLSLLVTYPASQSQSLPIPATRLSIASTTTVFLNVFTTFGAGTNTAGGQIRARRVR